MSRTSKALRRLSVPVLVTSVIMTGVSSIGFAGVAFAAPSNGAGGGAVVLSADNTGTAAANDPYATIQNDPYGAGDDTITVTATYKQGAQSNGTNAGEALTFTASGHATFVSTGTQTATCTTTAGDLGTCTLVVEDPVSEAPVITATPTPATPTNDTTVATSNITLHISSLTFNNCAQTGANTANNAPTAPDVYCYSQQTAGQAVTQVVTYRQDGAPKSGVSIEIDASNANAAFAATQPAGSIYYAIDEVDCTTNAQGQCSFTYTDNTVGDQEEFDAFTLANTSPYPNSEADEIVDFIASATPGRIVDNNSDTRLRPPSQSSGRSRPGDAIQKSFTLYSTCTPVAPDTNCYGTALANRSVTLTVDHGFFTPNCTADGSLNGPSYAQCKFSPTPTAGTPVGSLQSLGTHVTVTTDANGDFGATLGIARDAGFDDDGYVFATITGVAVGSAAVLPADNGNTSTTTSGTCTANVNNPGCPQRTQWSTDNTPLNGGTITFVPVDGTDISGNPNNVPTVQERVYVLHLTDQFGNLTAGTNPNFSGGLVDLSFTGAGDVRECDDNYTSGNACTSSNTLASNPGVLGSYTDPVNGFQDRIISFDDTAPGLQTVTATWHAPRTTFATYTAGVGVNPAVVTFANDTVDKTATLKFNFYDQAAQPVVTFSTTPSNTVSAGTVVTVSATVKDQFGFPIAGYPVDFFVNGTNVASCNPIHNNAAVTTNSAGKAGFSFGCNNPGTAAVTIVVADTHGNEIARGVQNITFTNGTPPPTTGDPSFTLNVHTIGIGQCAVLTVAGTAGHTITIFVKGAGAAGFTALNSMQPTQHMRVCPGTNSTYKVSSDIGTSAAQTLLVKAIETLVVSRAGQSGNFAGHVIPGVVGRKVQVFFYVDGGHVEDGGVGVVRPGGNFSFSHTVNHPGKVVHFFAQTFADGYNTSGRSRLVSVQY